MDWVNKRAACTLADVLPHLKEQVKGDVQKYNKTDSNVRRIRPVEISSPDKTGFPVPDFDTHAELAAFASNRGRDNRNLPAGIPRCSRQVFLESETGYLRTYH